MQNQRRWLLIVILILIVLCLLLYFLLRPLLPIIPGTLTPTLTPTPTSVREMPTPTPTFPPKPVWGPGNYILVHRDDYQPATPLPTSFPALASHIDVLWDQIPASGSVFNWATVEAKVAQIAAQQITLADERRISRPVWLTLPVFWRQGECSNDVPPSVKATAPDHLITVVPPTPSPPTPTVPPASSTYRPWITRIF